MKLEDVMKNVISKRKHAAEEDKDVMLTIRKSSNGRMEGVNIAIHNERSAKFSKAVYIAPAWISDSHRLYLIPANDKSGYKIDKSSGKVGGFRFTYPALVKYLKTNDLVGGHNLCYDNECGKYYLDLPEKK